MSTNQPNVILAEDDPEQLGFLESLVKTLRPKWHIRAKVSDAADLGRALIASEVHLAILDVRFSESTSIDVLSRMRETVPVVFVSGDPSYAADAFSCNAVDYVLKPVSPERFEQALLRAEGVVRSRMPRPGGVDAPPLRPRSLCVFRGQELCWTPVGEVRYFEAQRKYTRVVGRDTEGLLRMGITETLQHLDPDQFWRIHRGLILNMAHMAAARRDELGRLRVRIKDRPETLLVSKPYEHLFRDGFT